MCEYFSFLIAFITFFGFLCVKKLRSLFMVILFLVGDEMFVLGFFFLMLFIFALFRECRTILLYRFLSIFSGLMCRSFARLECLMK